MQICYFLIVLIILKSVAIKNKIHGKIQYETNTYYKEHDHHIEKRQIPKVKPTIYISPMLHTKSNIFTTKQKIVPTTTRASTKQVTTTTAKIITMKSTYLTVAPVKYNPVQLKQYCQCFNVCVSRMDNIFPLNTTNLNSHPILADISRQSTISYKIDMCENDTCAFYSDVKYPFREESSKNLDTSKGILIRTCGFKHYFLGKETIAASENQKFCCSLGMRSALITKNRELFCIHSSLEGKTKEKTFKKNCGSNTGVSLYEENFATGFRDLYQNLDFISCPTRARLSEDLWLDKQPDNLGGKEYCTAVKFSANSSAMGYMDIPCDAKVKPMCQKTASRPVPPYSLLALSIITAINFKCPPNNCPGETQHAQMYQVCCSLGMYGATFETQKEFDCIQKIYFQHMVKTKDSTNRAFWMAYQDANHFRTFLNCPNNTRVNDDLWALNQPDNVGGIESSALIMFSGDPVKIGLHDTSGIALHGGICQYIPDVGNTITTTKIPNALISLTPGPVTSTNGIKNNATSTQLYITSLEKKTDTTTVSIRP